MRHGGAQGSGGGGAASCAWEGREPPGNTSSRSPIPSSRRGGRRLAAATQNGGQDVLPRGPAAHPPRPAQRPFETPRACVHAPGRSHRTLPLTPTCSSPLTERRSFLTFTHDKAAFSQNVLKPAAKTAEGRQFYASAPCVHPQAGPPISQPLDLLAWFHSSLSQTTCALHEEGVLWGTALAHMPAS